MIGNYVTSLYDDSLYSDKNINLIIDLGCKTIKVGYGLESEPREILKTPEFFQYSKFMMNDNKAYFNEREFNELDFGEKLKFEVYIKQ